MAAFSFQRATAALPSFLRQRRKGDDAPRPPLRAVTDLGSPWAAAAKTKAAPTRAPAPAATPRQESIVELLRRLERGLSERAEAASAETPAEPSEPTDPSDVDSALKTALDTLQRMARQPR